MVWKGKWAQVRALRGITLDRVRKGQGFWSRLFAGSVLRDGKGVRCISAHGGGGRAGRAGEGTGGQWRLTDGD